MRQTFAHQLPITGAVRSVSRHATFFALLVLGLTSAAASALLASAWPLLGWFAAMTATFGLFALRARSVRRPAYYFLEWTLASPMVVLGLVLPPVDAGWRRPGLEPASIHEPGSQA